MKRTSIRRKTPERRPERQMDYTPRPRAVALRIDDGKARACVLVPKTQPWSSEAYRRRVAALSCIHCGRAGPSQAAHGPALGKGIKASDRDLFPLCADRPGEHGCHYRFDQYQIFNAADRRAAAAQWAEQTRERLGLK
jgi:hypothetical protein